MTWSLARRLSRRANTALLTGLICMVSACTGAGNATTTAGIDRGLDLTDLSGSWENESVLLRVNDAGDYVVLAAGEAEADQVLTGGFVARDEARFIFVTGVGGECPGQSGVYEAAIEGEVLTLTVVDDPCDVRAAWFASPFSAGN